MAGNNDSRRFLAKSPPGPFGGNSIGDHLRCTDSRCNQNTTCQHSSLVSSEPNNRRRVTPSSTGVCDCHAPCCRRHNNPRPTALPSCIYPPINVTRPRKPSPDDIPKGYLRPNTLWKYQPPSTASKEVIQFWKDLVRLANHRLDNITQYPDEAEDFKSFDTPSWRIGENYYPTLDDGRDVKDPREVWDQFEEGAIDRAVFTDVDGLEENESLKERHEAWKTKQRKKYPGLVDMHYVNHRKLQREAEEKEAKEKKVKEKASKEKKAKHREVKDRAPKERETQEAEAEESSGVGAALRRVLSLWT